MVMNKKAAFTAGAAGLGLAITAISGVAATGNGEDGEAGSTNFSESQAADASAAALAATDGGKVNSVERDSENGATWEVEVTQTDGNTVDVRLDEAYDVVVIEGDADTAGED